MKEVYTLIQLKEAWSSYKTDKVVKVLKGGKWYIQPTGSSLGEGITEAKVITYGEAMSFPVYLEKHYE